MPNDDAFTFAVEDFTGLFMSDFRIDQSADGIHLGLTMELGRDVKPLSIVIPVDLVDDFERAISEAVAEMSRRRSASRRLAA